MDTKFSVAVHILILISEAPKALTSDQMAQSAGTNASYIRKILALLKRAGIVEGHRGVGGYVLRDAAKNLSLLEIYRAVMADKRQRGQSPRTGLKEGRWLISEPRHRQCQPAHWQRHYQIY